MADLFESQAIISRHAQRAPVNVEAIARDLGLSVYLDRLPPDVAGKIVRNPSGYSVYLNPADPTRRRRFTLAHEIAHYVLHRDLIGDDLIDDGMYRSKLGGRYERQANQLAADILMPPGLVRGYYLGGTNSPVELGNIFDVSADAMRIRLQELNLINVSQGAPSPAENV
jgi:Zn-dependent peptidase ImmA (M78 family)